MKKYYISAIFIFVMQLSVISQEIMSPNFAIASHPMRVEKIYYSEYETVIELSIENKSAKGFFCADKNISLLNCLNSKEYLLKKSEGIPVCPSTYRFSYIGEILKFQLFFQKTDKSVKYIDIIENCSDNCFSVKGIILDENMNQSINIAYEYYNKGKLDFALEAFKMAVKENADYPYGVIHYNIVQIYAEKNDFISAKKWYSKIVNSNFRDKAELMLKLQAKIYYNSLLK